MKRSLMFVKRSFVLLLTMLLLVGVVPVSALAETGGGAPAPDASDVGGAAAQPVPVTSVSIVLPDDGETADAPETEQEQKTAALTIGQTLSLTAEVLPDNASNKALDWTSSDESVAAVDADGLIEALAAGTATVTATANDGSGQADNILITVTAAAEEPPQTDALLPQGGAADADAEPTVPEADPTNPTNPIDPTEPTEPLTEPEEPVTPPPADPAANGGPADAEGTAPTDAQSDVPTGADRAGTDPATEPPQTGDQPPTAVAVTGIAVTAADEAASVAVGGTLQLLAAVTPEDATDATVAWRVENGTGSATVDAQGLLEGVSIGTVTVFATANDNSGVSGSISIEVTAPPQAFAGEGTAEAPFLIETAAQLQLLASLVNGGDIRYGQAHYRQIAPIDLNTTAYTPIGTAASPFAGAFDGQGKGIAKLSGGGGNDWFGLFSVTDGAALSGIALTDVSIGLNGAYAGAAAIVGHMQGGTLTDSFVTGSITTDFADGATGGLVGALTGGRIENCFNAAALTVQRRAGGIAGVVDGAAEIAHCYSVGRVAGDADVGSVVGRAAEGVAITDCYAVDGTDAKARRILWASGTKQETFAGFDFTDAWTMGDGYYALPVLRVSPFAGDSGWVREEKSYPTGYRPIDRTVPGYTMRRRSRNASVDADTYMTPNLPPVLNQNPHGTCWALAIAAAAEIGMIKQGVASSSSVDYAELQLVWFHHKGAKKADGTYNDPLGNFGGDRNDTSDANIWSGDNYFFASRTVASRMGMMQEDSRTAYGSANARRIQGDGGLPYAYAFEKNAAHLENLLIIPFDSGRDVIKDAIVTYGAVTINYEDDDSYFKDYSYDLDKGYYVGDRKYYYCSEESYTNHAVTIVGWDDTVAADNFYDAYNDAAPTGNGAWIVRNSWGADYGDAGNFYMSYETVAVTSRNYQAWAWDFAPSDNYDLCYQYDGTASLRDVVHIRSAQPRIANVFTAQENGKVEAVSFWLDDHADVNYSVSIYKNPTDAANPASGTLVSAATTNGKTTYVGYYTVPLNAPVPVKKGDKFAAVVTFTSNVHQYGWPFWVPLDKSTDTIGWLRFYSYSSAGQSFFSSDGITWQDVGVNNGGNLRIKAFTSKDTPVESITVTSAGNAKTVEKGSTLQMSAAVLPATAEDKTYTWSVANRTGEATISASGLLSATKIGTVTVVATANDGGGAVGEMAITITEGGATFPVTADLAGTGDAPELWIDGVKYGSLDLSVSGTQYTAILADREAKTLVTYSYNSTSATDPHTVYPTGMTVWKLTFDTAEGKYIATRISALDDLLMYAGSSIRITGNKGIRMITSISTATKNQLTSEAGYHGYHLVEYGTAVAWKSLLGEQPLVLGKSYTMSNFAYKRGEADPVFKLVNGMTQYTNVLVGFDNDQCIPDLAMCPYIILEDAAGEQITLYGGTVLRSIGYIAYQNRNAFAPKTASYNYIWDIIHHVYGARYDADYKG